MPCFSSSKMISRMILCINCQLLDFFVSAVLKAVSNVNDIIAPALVGKVRGLMCKFVIKCYIKVLILIGKLICSVVVRRNLVTYDISII